MVSRAQVWSDRQQMDYTSSAMRTAYRCSASLLRALLLAGGLCAAIPGWATTLSFDDARSLLSQVSDAQRAAEADVGRRTHEARAADSLHQPEVSLSAIELWGIKDHQTLDTGIGPLDIHYNLQGPRAQVSTTWSLYDGGRIEARQRALAAGVKEADAELERVGESLDLELASVYFGVELAANVERTRRSILGQADDQLDRAKSFEKRGVIATVERLNAQVARDEAAREHVRALRDLDIARMRLQRLLVQEKPVDPTTPLFVITSPITPLAQWLSMAEADNPILKGLNARRTQAEQGIASAESRWKPEVFAFGSYSLIKHYQTIIEPTWVAGVGVSFTLWSREDRSQLVSAAREGVRQVESLTGEARNQILSNVEAAYLKVAQAREQFLLLDSSLAAARENLRLRDRGFAEGQATSLDVNEARNALARAETARATAAFDFVVALSRLLEVSGQPRSLARYAQQAEVVLTP
jgi:outer membrane protein TolC